jgi:hypothetical protein
VSDDESGIRIVLCDRTAAVELPYARDAAVWDRASGYVRVLEATGGFRTFDPQTMEVMDSAASPSAGDAEGYRRGNAIVQRILDDGDKRGPSDPEAHLP